MVRKSSIVFQTGIFYSKAELVVIFSNACSLRMMWLLDRETRIGQVVFEEKSEAKLGVVVHAEHFSENASSDDYHSLEQFL